MKFRGADIIDAVDYQSCRMVGTKHFCDPKCLTQWFNDNVPLG